MKLKRPVRTDSGHTLIELLVVTTLMALVTALIAQVWRPLSQSTYQMRAQAVGLAEQRLAMEFLRQDLGIATRAQAESSSKLLIQREGPALNRTKQLRSGESDPGVRYSFVDGILIRDDVHTGESFAVAYELDNFLTETDSLGRTHIRLLSQTEVAPHSLELIWSR